MPNALAIAQKYKSPRYSRLERREEYVEGEQYAGRWPFLQGGDGAPPVQERAPCVVYGIVKNAIQDLIDFMMGEGRYPTVTTGTSENDEVLDPDWGLNEDDSHLMERWINGPLTKAARLKSVFLEAMAIAMGCGSVGVVACVRNGTPAVDALPGKWCNPTFDPRTRAVTSLEVFYPYITERQRPTDGVWEDVCMLYRRVIDATGDTVFLPGEGKEDGTMPRWAVDVAQSTTHQLGYCPVVWYAFDRPAPTAEHADGKAIHDALFDELDALNMSLSQHHRAALYAGDPQMWETGVEADVNPAPSARAARVFIEPRSAGPGGATATIFTTGGRAQFGSSGGARMKGPGVVWRYPSDQSKVGMLTLPDGALGVIAQNSDDLRKKIAEDLSVVLIDPTDVKTFGAMSGKALAFLFCRQVSRGDRIRSDAGDKLVLATIDMLLRLCLSVYRTQGAGLRMPAMTKVAAVLTKFEAEVAVPLPTGMVNQDGTTATAVSTWFGPSLDLQWGRYFPPSAEEENFIVTMCVATQTANLMPMEIILEKLRDVFDFGSTEELLAKLEEAKAKAQDEALKAQDAGGAIDAKHAATVVAAKGAAAGGSGFGAKGDKAA